MASWADAWEEEDALEDGVTAAAGFLFETRPRSAQRPTLHIRVHLSREKQQTRSSDQERHHCNQKASELQKNGNFEDDEKTDSIILSKGGKNMRGTIF